MALTDNLLAYWKTDESSGDAADSSGNGYTLTNASVTYTTGKINNGAVFSSASLQNSSSNFAPAGSFSISLWVKYNTAVGADCLISKDDGINGTRSYALYFSSGGNPTDISFFIQTELNASTTINSGATTIASGSWHHIVITYEYITDGTSELRMYINGTQVAISTTAVGPVDPTSPNFSLGKWLITGLPRYLNGNLDEIGFWTKELTSAEVTSLYNSGSGLAYPFSSFTSPLPTFFRGA